MSRDQFQKAQDVPEVKAAREAFLEAQKKFAETVKKAVGSKPGAVASDSKSTPLSYDQFQKVQDVPEVKAAREVFLEAQKKFADSVKKAVASGPGRAVASAAKVTPVMLQTAPATSPGVASAPKNSLP